MNDLERALVELSRVRSLHEPVVSLYLDVHWGEVQRREQALLFVREASRRVLGHTLPDGAGMPGLRSTLARIEERVGTLTRSEVPAEERGLALFACEERRLWREVRTGSPLHDALETDGFPHLLQLARLRGEGAPAVVVVTSARGAEVYRMELGALALEETLTGVGPHEDDVKQNAGTGKPGRNYEREAKDERHEENVERRNRQVAAREAAALFDAEPRSAVVLVGTAGNVAALERELPERVRARVVARFPRPRAWEKEGGGRRVGVTARAGTALAGAEEREEHALVDHLVGEALRGGLAVLGPADVVSAVNQRRVHQLVLAEDLHGNGWACDGCDAMGSNAEDAEQCPYCGGEVHVLLSLAEALVARTLSEGGEVAVVAPERKLASYRGVGAFLRQAAASGVRGAGAGRASTPGAGR